MEKETSLTRRIEALQSFVNDQFYSTIRFCLNLPFGGEELIEQMLRELAEYHTESSLRSALFLGSHKMPRKDITPIQALEFVIHIHIKERFMEKEWFRIEADATHDSFTVSYKKDKCFYYDHCNALVCYGYRCICVRRFFYEGIIKRLTGQSYSSFLLTQDLKSEFCSFEFVKSDPKKDEVKKIREKINETFEENARLNEAVKARTGQLEIRNKLLQKEINEREITEKKLWETQKQLQKAHNFLEERVKERTIQLEFANKELEAFNYAVSHDLKAPLRHISSFSKLLKAELEPLNNKSIDEYSSFILEASEKMDRLISDLLTLSQAGSAEIKKSKVKLNEIIEEIKSDFGPEVKDRQISWKVALFPEIEGDSGLLKLALSNLISNAIKYSQRKERAVIEIGHFMDDKKNRVYFVRDNGTGFDMKYKNILFDPFKRFHEEGDFEGSGVGLSNVKRIIDRHNGTIWAESKVNEETTFYFTLSPAEQMADSYGEQTN